VHTNSSKAKRFLHAGDVSVTVTKRKALRRLKALLLRTSRQSLAVEIYQAVVNGPQSPAPPEEPSDDHEHSGYPCVFCGLSPRPREKPKFVRWSSTLIVPNSLSEYNAWIVARYGRKTLTLRSAKQDLAGRSFTGALSKAVDPERRVIRSLPRRYKPSPTSDFRTWGTLNLEFDKLCARQNEIDEDLKSCKDLREQVRLQALLEKVEGSMSDINLSRWTIYQTILGHKPDGQSFSKKKVDQVMESSFGSLDKAGTMDFVWNGEVSDPSRIFSLYLGRKAFLNHTVAKKTEALGGFFERVTQDMKTLDNDMASWVRTVSEAVFFPSSFKVWDESYVRTKDVGCLEASRREGGVRSAYYLAKAHNKQVEPLNKDEVTAKPVAIIAGGKIRVITKSGASHQYFGPVNKYMAHCIRKCAWSLFGKEVSDVLNQQGMDLREEESYLSGDLESATDHFDGRLTEIVISVALSRLGIDDPETLEQAFLATTRATLRKGLRGRKPVPPLVQSCGQLMGSFLSFGPLCILNFCAATFHDLRPQVLSLPRWLHREAITDFDRLLINGDDLVKPVTSPDNWLDGVRRINGRASRGKTLLNKRYYTVNSMLVDGQTRTLVPCIRPSIMNKIGDGVKPAPERLRCPLEMNIPEYTKRYIIEMMNADLPRSLGGLGLVRRFDPVRFISAWNAQMITGERVVLEKKDGGFSVVAEEDARRDTGLFVVPRKQLEEIRKSLYLSTDVQWTTGKKIECPLSNAITQWNFSTKKEKERIKKVYIHLMDLEMDEEKVVRLPRIVGQLYALEEFLDALNPSCS